MDDKSTSSITNITNPTEKSTMNNNIINNPIVVNRIKKLTYFFISSTISFIIGAVFPLNISLKSLLRFSLKLLGKILHSFEQMLCIRFSPGCVISFNAKIISK